MSANGRLNPQAGNSQRFDPRLGMAKQPGTRPMNQAPVVGPGRELLARQLALFKATRADGLPAANERSPSRAQILAAMRDFEENRGGVIDKKPAEVVPKGPCAVGCWG